nr:MAG TPA: hypothetical protein [Caudoviricetes sp.]
MYPDLFSFPLLRRYNRELRTIIAAYRNPEKYTQALIIAYKLRLFSSFPCTIGQFS